MDKGLLHHIPKEEKANHSVAHCEESAHYFARRITQICSDVDAILDTGPVNVTGVFVYSLILALLNIVIIRH